jgi:DNA-binding NtrC family response regulator
MARVIVIDDEPLVLRTLATSLRRAGHRVFAWTRLSAALEAATWSQPDLLICDLFLSVAEGVAVISEVRQRFPNVPIIAISGGGPCHEIDCLAKARAAGAVHSLRKPFPLKKLTDLVEHCLGARDPKDDRGQAWQCAL